LKRPYPTFSKYVGQRLDLNIGFGATVNDYTIHQCFPTSFTYGTLAGA